MPDEYIEPRPNFIFSEAIEQLGSAIAGFQEVVKPDVLEEKIEEVIAALNTGIFDSKKNEDWESFFKGIASQVVRVKEQIKLFDISVLSQETRRVHQFVGDLSELYRSIPNDKLMKNLATLAGIVENKVEDTPVLTNVSSDIKIVNGQLTYLKDLIKRVCLNLGTELN